MQISCDNENFRGFRFGRDVAIDMSRLSWLERRKIRFRDNVITTSQYTWWNFLPKSLWGQFQRIANFFFLGASILMLVGTTTELWKSPYSYETTLYPLIMVICVTMALQIKDDVARHRADARTSCRPATTVAGTKQWKDICVGDFIIVKNKESLPADVILLASSQSDGLAYVETSNIDGETNLKLRVAKKNMQTFLCSGCDFSLDADPGTDRSTKTSDRDNGETRQEYQGVVRGGKVLLSMRRHSRM